MSLSESVYKSFFRIALFFLFIPVSVFAQKQIIRPVKYYNTHPEISIRALGSINETIWFAASKGVWGYITDLGITIKMDSIKVDSIYPEFRSIAVINDSTVFLLSVGSPAYLFKTTNRGKTWDLVYTNRHKDIFFDSIRFFDEQNGIALADPMDGCFQIIKTADQGKTWETVSCKNIPPALEGEACFAASNSCLDIAGNNVWFVTGGKHARIFHSTDGGEHFKVYNTPMIQGETMTGIFSLDFTDNTTGIIAGGNYDKADSSYTCLAITHDAGKTWKKINTDAPFFGSCVKIDRTQAWSENETLISQEGDTMNSSTSMYNAIYITGHYGTFKMKLNYDIKPVEIVDASGNKLKFHTCLLNYWPGKKVWLAGSKGIIATFEKQ